jgi:hypothetical protein
VRTIREIDEDLDLMRIRLTVDGPEDRKTALRIYIDRLLDERLEKKYTPRHAGSRDIGAESS